MNKKPSTFKALFKFYYDYVKPLYASVSADNILPQEVLFELNAAFDHISRKWEYKETEKACVEKAYGHLKRSCLDIFKLKVKDTHEQYKELLSIDISIIDNGDFERKIKTEFFDIKNLAKEARRFEGMNKDSTGITPAAFDKWMPFIPNV